MCFIIYNNIIDIITSTTKFFLIPLKRINSCRKVRLKGGLIRSENILNLWRRVGGGGGGVMRGNMCVGMWVIIAVIMSGGL